MRAYLPKKACLSNHNDATFSKTMDQLRKGLLEILACPRCKSPVRQEGNGLACTNGECRLVFPIRDGVPIMLVKEAERRPA